MARGAIAVGHPVGTRGQAACVVLALSLFGCGEPPALKVGPVGYDQAEIATLGPDGRTTLAQITAFGLAVAADSVDALIRPKIRADLRSIVLQRVAMELAVSRAGVDDDELRASYAEDPRHELVVRHLVVLSERWRPQEHRDSARTRAAEALERARSGEDFEALVAEYSDEPRAAERGGLLEPGRQGSWVPEFWDAASSLEEGELSGVVETEFGFHVIRLEERRVVPFEEVRDVVLEQFVDLPRALGNAAEWVGGFQAQMRVDTAAVHRWRAGEQVEGPIVRWPDSLSVPDYGPGDLRQYIRTFRTESVDDVRAMDPGAVVDFVMGTTRTHILLARARTEGIEPSQAQRSAIENRWQTRVARWASAFGFRPGLSRKEVKSQALEALSMQAQSAVQARASLPELGSRLDELYPISRPAAPTQ